MTGTEQAIRERPILFSGPMVRAIREGRKTQTRRVITPQPDGITRNGEPWVKRFIDRLDPETKNLIYTDKTAGGEQIVRRMASPYGQPGDRLWVRETWGLYDTEPSDGPERARVFYKATDGDRHDLRYQRWRSSIHMPRWASRITLEVLSVRAERLQAISEADAVAEGRSLTLGDPAGYFPETWDSINAARGHGWRMNPWVWAVEFKVIRGAA